MAGREAVRAELAREAQQVGELDPLVAAHARDRGTAREIVVGEAIDHARPERALIVEDIMRDAEPIGDGARVAYVAPGAAAARAPHRLAMIVELQRDPDRFGTRCMRQRGHH